MYKFALNLQRAETLCQVHVHLYVAKFKDQSSLEFSLTGKFLLSTESITSVAFQLNSQSQFLIYSRIFRTFPIAIVFPGKKSQNYKYIFNLILFYISNSVLFKLSFTLLINMIKENDFKKKNFQAF